MTPLKHDNKLALFKKLHTGSFHMKSNYFKINGFATFSTQSQTAPPFSKVQSAEN